MPTLHNFAIDFQFFFQLCVHIFRIYQGLNLVRDNSVQDVRHEQLCQTAQGLALANLWKYASEKILRG